MKKIVALVLSLVMVLGLATVAFGATTTKYEHLYAKDANTLVTVDDVDIVVTPAKAVKYDKTYGNPTANGNIEYVTVTDSLGNVWPASYKFVNSLAEADVVLYKDAAYKQAKFYLAVADGVFYKEGVAFTNFGEDCGQTTYDADKDLGYYTIKGALTFGVYEETENPTNDYLMVAGELVPVTFVTSHKVAHTPVYETKDGKVLSIECGACGLQAVKAANMMSVPVGITAFDGTWYWPTAAAAPVVDGEKVESAQTFDAGIAMYVGMSVMAAAGSAVVLKKKD